MAAPTPPAQVVDPRAIAEELRTQVLRRPFWTLGIGAAAGYALGGGVGPRMLASLAMMAGRAVVWNTVASTFTGRPNGSAFATAPRAQPMDDRL